MTEQIDPSENASGSITGLYQAWRQGDSNSWNELIERFRPRLLALARARLNGNVQRAADAEDAIQSAILSFWETYTPEDLHENVDRNDLWNLLCTFTKRKALRHQEKEHALKRGAGRAPSEGLLNEVTAAQAGSELEFVCVELLELLDEELRNYAILRLEGHKNHEIAAKFDCSERKVERKLQLIREIWKREIDQWKL